jgi:hypothetical protein
VTDDGLKHLKGLKKLNLLQVPEAIITDDALRSLVDAGLLHALEQATGSNGSRAPDTDGVVGLSLARTKVTDAGLAALKPLQRLTFLDLTDTAITDAALKELKGFPQLATLILSRTKVTDEGLAELKGLPALRSLNLMGTKVTNAGVAELKKDAQRLRVTR